MKIMKLKGSQTELHDLSVVFETMWLKQEVRTC